MASMPPMPPMQMQMSHPHNNLSTTKCIYCMTQLSYPANSVYIQCPKCNNTMNPQSTTNYINCVGCGTLLSHSPTSLTIQCPRCLIIMELPTRLNAGPPLDPNQGAGKQGALQMKQPLKKRKDPNAPKRASNAYMIFCKERRSKLREERPDLPFGKIGAKLGEIWRNMTAEEKRPYEERAANDRERYKDELGHYQPGPGEEPQPPLKKQATPTAKLMMGKSPPDTPSNPSLMSPGFPMMPQGVPQQIGAPSQQLMQQAPMQLTPMPDAPVSQASPAQSPPQFTPQPQTSAPVAPQAPAAEAAAPAAPQAEATPSPTAASS